MGVIERLGIIALESLEALGAAFKDGCYAFVNGKPGYAGLVKCSYRLIVASYIPVIFWGFFTGMLLLIAVDASALPQHSAEEVGANLALCLAYLSAPLTVIAVTTFNAYFISESLGFLENKPRATVWDWMLANCFLAPFFVSFFLFCAFCGVVFINDVNVNQHMGVLLAGIKQGMNGGVIESVLLRATIDSAVVIAICASLRQRCKLNAENIGEDSGIGAVVGLSTLGVVVAEFALGALTR